MNSKAVGMEISCFLTLHPVAFFYNEVLAFLQGTPVPLSLCGFIRLTPAFVCVWGGEGMPRSVELESQ